MADAPNIVVSVETNSFDFRWHSIVWYFFVLVDVDTHIFLTSDHADAFGVRPIPMMKANRLTLKAAKWRPRLAEVHYWWSASYPVVRLSLVTCRCILAFHRDTNEYIQQALFRRPNMRQPGTEKRMPGSAQSGRDDVPPIPHRHW